MKNLLRLPFYEKLASIFVKVLGPVLWCVFYSLLGAMILVFFDTFVPIYWERNKLTAIVTVVVGLYLVYAIVFAHLNAGLRHPGFV